MRGHGRSVDGEGVSADRSRPTVATVGSVNRFDEEKRREKPCVKAGTKFPKIAGADLVLPHFRCNRNAYGRHLLRLASAA